MLHLLFDAWISIESSTPSRSTAVEGSPTTSDDTAIKFVFN